MNKQAKLLTFPIICIFPIMVLSGCGGGSAGQEVDTVQPLNKLSDTVQPLKTLPDNVEQLNKLPGTLIIVGDSIMAGCKDSIDQPHADYSMTSAHLVASQGVHVVNLSRSGNNMWLADSQRVDGGINFTQGGKRGTAIWITLGVNDFLWEISSLEEFRDRYLKVLSRIETIPAQKIFCATPLMSGHDYQHRTSTEGATLEDYRQIVRDIAAAGHCALVDTSQWFSATEIYDECNMPDTLHLGEDGHRRYTNMLLEEIRDNY